jgi:ribosome-associated toxin RatA of RatAB toxin-antitoxin module
MKTARYFALVCSLLVPLAPAWAAPDMAVSVRQAGTLLSVEGWLETRASRDVAWAVLTDYAHFPEFVPGIQSNRVLATAGHVKTIEQRGEVVTGMLRLRYDGTMRVEESPDAGLSILFLSGPFKDVRGEWRMEPSAQQQPFRLVYEMHMDMMKAPFPPPLAPSIAEQQVRVWVETFAREMERRMERRKAK